MDELTVVASAATQTTDGDFRDVDDGDYEAVVLDITRFTITKPFPVVAGKKPRSPYCYKFQFNIVDDPDYAGTEVGGMTSDTWNLSEGWESHLALWSKAIMGPDFVAPAPGESFNLRDLIGKPCHILVETKVSAKGGKFSNVKDCTISGVHRKRRRQVDAQTGEIIEPNATAAAPVQPAPVASAPAPTGFRPRSR
jgi:hypothetical protein